MQFILFTSSAHLQCVFEWYIYQRSCFVTELTFEIYSLLCQGFAKGCEVFKYVYYCHLVVNHITCSYSEGHKPGKLHMSRSNMPTEIVL